MSVLTLAQAKAHLNITSTAVNLGDTELQEIIDSAENVFTDRCGDLISTSTTSRVRGGVEKLSLPKSPVLSLTSVTPVGGSALTVGDLYASRGGVVEYLAGGWFGDRWYDVVYAVGHGAVAADVPDGLMWGIKELVRHFAETQRGPARRPGSTGQSETSNTIPGAAAVYPFPVERALARFEQTGFA